MLLLGVILSQKYCLLRSPVAVFAFAFQFFCFSVAYLAGFIFLRTIDFVFQRLHCGCLVSRAEVHFTFFGKLCCKDCAKKMIRG
ncbi:hypothetical protein ACSQ67_010375 [Phaseolus vulgaris]